MQIEQICRACLREEDKMIDMHEKDIYQKFVLFANLTAEEIPNIPLNLCQSCEQKLNMSLDFKKDCQKSHEILLKYVKNTHDVDPEAAHAVATKSSRFEQLSQHEGSKQNCDENKKCIRCSYVGNHTKALSLHISRMHKDLKPRWCYACNGEFDNLIEHVATNHSDDDTCKICNKKFHDIVHLTEHVCSQSEAKSFQCSFCEKCFGKQCYLNAHLRKHTKSYECESCDESFTQLYTLKEHLKTHETEGDVGKQPAALELKEHMQGQVPRKCKFCKKKFKSASDVARHERIHTGKKPYVCQLCGKSFAISDTLKSHMMVHNMGPKISCRVCNKKFSRTTHLRVHLRRHTGEEPFVCTVCGKSFIQSSDLVEHNKTHGDLRPHQCSSCDKSFARSTSLKRHMSIHLREKPDESSQHQDSSSLTQRMTQHEVDKPRADRQHVCLMCNKFFMTDAMLTFHIKTHNVSFLEI